jgi:hypothetical protein
MIVTLCLATSDEITTGKCLFQATRNVGNIPWANALQQVTDRIDADRLRLSYFLSGEYAITYFAKAEDLPPDRVAALLKLCVSTLDEIAT